MKIVSWNVNSLKVRKDFVSLYLDEKQPDVLCLQELKLDTHAVPVEIFESRGYHVAMHAQKTWNGVLIASKSPIEDVHRGLEGGDEGQSRLVAGTIDGVRVVNLYCPQGSSADSPKFPYKLNFYKVLTEWVAAGELDKPTVILGDLNIAPDPEDVWSLEAFEGVPTYHPLEHEALGKLMDLGFIDAVKPHIEAGTFTFWDYRAMAFRFNRGMRIDHLLVNGPLQDAVRGGWVDRDFRKKKGPLKASDHAPVGIELDLSSLSQA